MDNMMMEEPRQPQQPNIKVKSNQFIIPEQYFEQDDQKIQVSSIEGCITIYQNTVVIILTQNNKIASIMEGNCDNWQMAEFGQEKIFDTEIKYGPRENDYQELICRGLIDIMYDKATLIKGFQDNNVNELKESNFRSPYLGKSLTLMCGLKAIPEQIQGQFYRFIRKTLAKELAKTLLV